MAYTVAHSGNAQLGGSRSAAIVPVQAAKSYQRPGCLFSILNQILIGHFVDWYRQHLRPVSHQLFTGR